MAAVDAIGRDRRASERPCPRPAGSDRGPPAIGVRSAPVVVDADVSHRVLVADAVRFEAIARSPTDRIDARRRVRRRPRRASCRSDRADRGPRRHARTSPRTPPEDAQADADQRQQDRERQSTPLRPYVSSTSFDGRHDDHHVRADAIRALGPARLPVREVADLDQHRHADLIDVERQRLLVDLDVRTPDRRRAPPARSARPARRCRPCVPRRPVVDLAACRVDLRRRSAASRRGRRRPASPPTRRGAGTSSCRARGCARAGRRRGRLTTTGCTVERHDESRVRDLVDVPRTDDADERQLGLARRPAPWPRCAHHHVPTPRSAGTARRPRRRCSS